jgi:hypothetical protein
LHSFAANGEGIYGNVIPLGIKTRGGVFAGPGTKEVPAHFFLAFVVENDDGAIFTLEFAVEGGEVPVVEFAGIGEAPFEGDVGVFGHAGEFASAGWIAALAIFDDLDFGAEAAAFSKSGLDEAIDFDQEAIVFVGILAWHRSLVGSGLEEAPNPQFIARWAFKKGGFELGGMVF